MLNYIVMGVGRLCSISWKMTGILFHGSLFPAGPFSLGIGGWRVEGGSGPGTERT